MTLHNTKLPKTIYVIQHLAVEDLGSFEDSLYAMGFRVRYFEAGIDDLRPALQYEGLTIILGGPIGVYETEDFPFLSTEIELLGERLAAHQPTLGICLGAQLIARALGAEVYAGEVKEIGWSCLELKAVDAQPLSALEDIPVLHWHGDTFSLPVQAELLASSPFYPNQAFRVGANILALQFHIEVTASSLERWFVGHRVELAQAEVDIRSLREENHRYADDLEQQAEKVLRQYLEQLEL